MTRITKGGRSTSKNMAAPVPARQAPRGMPLARDRVKDAGYADRRELGTLAQWQVKRTLLCYTSADAAICSTTCSRMS